MVGFRWFKKKTKPKTIYKNGLRWNLLPKGVYGREVYVPCITTYHYLNLGIKGDIDD